MKQLLVLLLLPFTIFADFEKEVQEDMLTLGKNITEINKLTVKGKELLLKGEYKNAKESYKQANMILDKHVIGKLHLLYFKWTARGVDLNDMKDQFKRNEDRLIILKKQNKTFIKICSYFIQAYELEELMKKDPSENNSKKLIKFVDDNKELYKEIPFMREAIEDRQEYLVLFILKINLQNPK